MSNATSTQPKSVIEEEMDPLQSFHCFCGKRYAVYIHRNSKTNTCVAICETCLRRSETFSRSNCVPIVSYQMTDEFAQLIVNGTQSFARQLHQQKLTAQAQKSEYDLEIERISHQLKQRAFNSPTSELVVRGQARQETLPATFTSRNQKWSHMPYQALAKVFEFAGIWKIRRVSRRWFDAFMDNHFKLIVSSHKLASTIIASHNVDEEIERGFSSCHHSFWQKQLQCHQLRNENGVAYQPEIYTRAINRSRVPFYDALIATRDKGLLSYFIRNYDGRSEMCYWDFGPEMKRYFERLSVSFAESMAIELFLEKFSHLVQIFGIPRSILDACFNVEKTRRMRNAMRENCDG